MTEDESPRRRRRHRRVVHPATHADPEDTPDFSEPRLDLEEDHATATQEIGSDDWWRAQRPPHWG